MSTLRVGQQERRPRVVVVGAGVAALEFVLALAELAPGRAEVELVAPDEHFVYRPFAVAQSFDLGDPFRIELDRVAAHAGAERFRTRIVSVDHANRIAFTSTGEPFPYDVLVVAAGARPEEALPKALTFGGPRTGAGFRELLADLEAGRVGSVAFAVPAGASWSLPLYELALLTAARLEERSVTERRLAFVTPEQRPLERFGRRASDAVADILAGARIDVHCGAHAAEVLEGELRLVPEGRLPAERVVTVPRLRGPHVAGLPSEGDGFVPTDRHGRVPGTTSVYAVGDATAFPVKHGGIAVDQAAAAAESVAARLGVPLRPKPFRPVLRGLLLTGKAPRFLWADLGEESDESSAVAAHPLWWPPGKIAGGRLAAYLHAEGLPVPPPPAGPAATPAETELWGRETTAR